MRRPACYFLNVNVVRNGSFSRSEHWVGYFIATYSVLSIDLVFTTKPIILINAKSTLDITHSVS